MKRTLGQNLSKRLCDTRRMKQRQLFSRPVQRRVPAHQLARGPQPHGPEQNLLGAAGGTAIQFVGQEEASVDDETKGCGQENQLSMGYALRIKSAQYWLQLGEVDQALLELGALSTTASDHPLAVKARLAVLQAVRRQKEITFGE